MHTVSQDECTHVLCELTAVLRKINPPAVPLQPDSMFVWNTYHLEPIAGKVRGYLKSIYICVCM